MNWQILPLRVRISAAGSRSLAALGVAHAR